MSKHINLKPVIDGLDTLIDKSECEIAISDGAFIDLSIRHSGIGLRYDGTMLASFPYNRVGMWDGIKSFLLLNELNSNTLWTVCQRLRVEKPGSFHDVAKIIEATNPDS